MGKKLVQTRAIHPYDTYDTLKKVSQGLNKWYTDTYAQQWHFALNWQIFLKTASALIQTGMNSG